MLPHRPFLGSVTAATVLVLTACGSPGDTADVGADPLQPALTVVASTNVYGSIAAAVGGDRAKVISLITDPAADPHSYESTPADAVTITEATIVVFNGGGYDDWVSRLTESAGGRRTVIDVSGLSGLEPAEDEFNEHFWYSLPTTQKVATQLAADLGTADPAYAAEYTVNAKQFNEQVDGLIEKAEAIGAATPGARVAVTEPVPGYLIETAGLMNATPDEFAEAIEEDTDPPAAVLQETLALFADDPVRALILNGQTQTPTTDQVRQAAEAAGVPVVEMTETLPAGQTEYTGWMSAQIDELADAVARA
ncbi:MAG: metal ABC transporter solute-binding protein, Zn/Mn family [Pseudonocardia sp.]